MARKSEESNMERLATVSYSKEDRPFVGWRAGLFPVLFGLIFLCAACLGLWTFFGIQRMQQAEFSETVATTCTGYARDFDAFIRHQEGRIGFLKSAIAGLLIVAEKENPSFSLVDVLETQITPLLNSAIANCNEADAVYLHLNPEANTAQYDITFVKSTDLSVKRLGLLAKEEYDPSNPGMTWFYASLIGEAPFWSEVFYLDALRDHYISVSAPIKINGRSVAVIGLFISLPRLIGKVGRLTDFDNSFGFLLNKDKQVLYHPDYGKGILFEQLEPISLPVFDENLSARATLSKIDSPEGRKFLAFSQLANGWILGLDVSLKDMRLPMQALTVYTIGITLILSFFTFLFAFLSVRLFSRPIASLTEAVNRFRQGDRGVRFSGNLKGTLGLLGGTFNALADELEKRVDTIRRQNDDISAVNDELEATNQQLQESYNVTEELSACLRKTIALTSKSWLKTFENQHSFLKESLDTVLTLIPDADYGTIYSATPEAFSIVSFVGHRFSRYYQIPKELLCITESPFLTNNAYGLPENKQELKGFLPELYLQERRPVEQTLGVCLQIAGEVYGLITLDIAEGRHSTFSEQHIEILSSFANIASSFLAIRSFVQQSEGFQKEIVLSFIKILELYDPYTQGHSENVALLSSVIAEELRAGDDLARLDSRDVKDIYWAGLVHDIGKILVPSDILKKKGCLTSEEYAIIQKHPQWGAEVLHSSEKLRDIADFVLFHHERWDGQGYPVGLKGEEIPYISRIISVADALEAMTSDRPYRKGISADIAFEELKKGAGSQFDPGLANQILSLSACREKISGIIQNKMHEGEGA